MRRLRLNVAMSLDGFIATPDGGYDWIPMDPTIDFDALFAGFDTFVMGRKTFMAMQAPGAMDPTAGRDVVVFSRTLDPAAFPKVRVTSEEPAGVVHELKTRTEGKDIWLFGGGQLFRTLLDAGVVDAVEVAVCPIMLSDGIPLLPPGVHSPRLTLTKHRVLPSGIVMLEYAT